MLRSTSGGAETKNENERVDEVDSVSMANDL